MIGKSAIVAAIQLCLGASARRSGRASSVGGLIKDGHPGPALLRIDLLNEGMDAYEFEKYGRVIQVERKINKSGGGGYALISHKGEVISREKRELEKLLQHFNIFVDNPCCILSQEQSKSFINGAEKEKYEFFLKVLSSPAPASSAPLSHSHDHSDRPQVWNESKKS
jgi:structural maintenance of chromosomes protein 6